MSLDNQPDNSSVNIVNPSPVTIPSAHEIAQRAQAQRHEDALSPLEKRQLNGILAYEEQRREKLFYAIKILSGLVTVLYLLIVYWVINHGTDKDSWHILLILAIPATSFTFLIIRILSKPESHSSFKDDDGIVPLINLVKELKGLVETKP